MIYTTNGYSLDNNVYETLLLRLYGFEEYYYYKNDIHYNDYLFILRQLDKIKYNKPIDIAYRNAILGWYISFKNLRRQLNPIYTAVITDKCQLKCKHCYFQNMKSENKFMSIDEFCEIYYRFNEYIRYFVNWDGNDVQVCHIEGGEATLNNDLTKMIYFLKKKNVDVCLLSNGIYISDEIIQALKDIDAKVQISIDGLEETHDYIRGKGTFKKSINTIKKLCDNNIKVNSNFVYNSHNYKDVVKLKEFLSQYNLRPTGVMRYIDMQNEYLRDLNEEEIKYYYQYQYFNERPCNVGYQNVISVGGSYTSCSKLNSYPIANVLTDTKEEFLFNVKTYVIRSRSVPVYCLDCKNVNSCLGSQICTGYHKYKMFNKEDTKCHILNKKEQTDICYPIDDLF